MYKGYDSMKISRKSGLENSNRKATSSANYKHDFYRTESLGLSSIENLGPGGSKSKVFEIKRN